MPKPKNHTFNLNGGRTTENGKTHWPDRLTITMDKSSAWRLIEQVQSQLKDGEEEIVFYGVGRLEDD